MSCARALPVLLVLLAGCADVASDTPADEARFGWDGARLRYAVEGTIPLAAPLLGMYPPQNWTQAVLDFRGPRPFTLDTGERVALPSVEISGGASRESPEPWATLWIDPSLRHMVAAEFPGPAPGYVGRFYWQAPSAWCALASALGAGGAQRVPLSAPGELTVAMEIALVPEPGASAFGRPTLTWREEAAAKVAFEVVTSPGIPCPIRVQGRTYADAIDSSAAFRMELTELRPGAPYEPMSMRRAEPLRFPTEGLGPRGLPPDEDGTPFPIEAAYAAALNDPQFQGYLEGADRPMLVFAVRLPIALHVQKGYLWRLDFEDAAGRSHGLTVQRFWVGDLQATARDSVTYSGPVDIEEPYGWSAAAASRVVTLESAAASAALLTSREAAEVQYDVVKGGTSEWRVAFVVGNSSACDLLTCAGTEEQGSVAMDSETAAIVSYVGLAE